MNWRKEVDEFKAAMQAEAPRLAGSTIRFGFFGIVGGGKSVTAGKFAVSITPQGLIGWVDGEGKRSGFAIDQVAEMAVKKYGGTKQSWIDRFKIIHINPPFNPLRIVAAIEALEEVGCKCIILDVLSQAWDSDGGYLDLKNEELDRIAGEDERKRDRSQASAAAHVKPWTHQKLVNKVNASKADLVLLFQAKQKYNAKIFKPDDFVTPIQESGLTRTALAVGLVEANQAGEGGHCTFAGGLLSGTKHTHPMILRLLPKNGEQLQFEHGETVAAWCRGGGSVDSPKPTPVVPGAIQAAKQPGIDALKLELWNLTKEKHGGSRKAMAQWCWDEGVMDLDMKIEDATEDQLRGMIAMAKKKLTK